MEALLLLAGELLAPLGGLLVLGVQLLAAFASHLLQSIWWLLERRPANRRPAWRRRLDDEHLRRLHRIGRGVRRGLLALLLLTATAVVLVNYAFLDETVAFVTRRAEARTGIAIRYATMDGNLFTGAIRFTDLRLARPTDETVRFDFQIDEVAVRFSIGDLLRGRRSIREATVNGVRGHCVRLRAATLEPRGDLPPESITIPVPWIEPRRSFRIGQLKLTNVELSIEDRTAADPVAYPIMVRSMSARPLRSTFLWFDVLFRSNIDLTIAGARVAVENRTDGDRRHTAWQVTDLDARVLASLVGGPFTLFTAGRIDLEAQDTWTLERQTEISMDWVMRLRDVRTEVPPSTPGRLRPAAARLADYVNDRTEPLEIGFTLTLHEARFAGAATLDARQIWSGVTEAFLAQTIGLDGAQIEKLRDGARAGLRRVEEYLKKRDERKKRE